jgi:hypothetical protein
MLAISDSSGTLGHLRPFSRHFEAEAVVEASAADLFAALDEHAQLSGHMSKASWMMGGGSMDIVADADHFRKVGSHIRLAGRAFGVSVSLDEIVTHYAPPFAKTWETVGVPALLVVGAYRMGFAISPRRRGCLLRIFIDYDLPKEGAARILGLLLGGVYARWCVRRMVRDASVLFPHTV